HDVLWATQHCHPRLRAGVCAAFAIEVDDEERLVVVAEVRAEDGDAARAEDWSELHAAIRGAVAERLEIQPFAIALIPPRALPKTSSGKIQHTECRRQYLAGELPVIAQWRAAAPAAGMADAAVAAGATAAAAPGGPAGVDRELARRIRALLEDHVAGLLGLPRAQIDPAAPLSRLGVDSMAGVQLAAALGRQLGRDLPVTLVWNHPSIDALVDHLARTGGDAAAAAPGAALDGAAADEPIAVIGIGCRFPGGADDPAAFWALLEAGFDAITDVPRDRWDVDALYDPDPDAPGKMYVRSGGFLRGIDQFDPRFFGITPREAISLDPQQRLLLEVAWHALEDAGVPPLGLSGRRVGVFVGASGSDYAARGYFSGDPRTIDPYSATGSIASTAAGRLSYTLGLVGPALAVDTACSSSLVALHLACQSLRSGEAELALAGGVNAILAPEPTIYMCRTRALSPRGRCRTFAADADGYVRSEGCGVVVLKRLSRALADGDPIYAVVRGSAVNQDGRSNGMTAPSGQAQRDVIRGALQRARVAAADLAYVEAHGTGTPLGDPIEIDAIADVLGAGRAAGAPLLVGSVKTNLGHTEAAAGIAGLIKTALALHHGRIPAHLHAEPRNPSIPWAGLAVDIPHRLQDWPGGGPRLAGVSSFGFSGTNAHVILEAAPQASPSPARAAGVAERAGAGAPGLARTEDRLAVLSARSDEGVRAAAAVRTEDRLDVAVLSARSEDALRATARRHAQWLAARPALELADVCHTTRTGRSHLEHRLAAVAGSLDELRASLEAFAAGAPAPAVVHAARETAGGRPRL
ncbi:MAG TPA: beta-ketoacyl synthase N-terminal-like domain-containing protein, partial [Kofleriaceae bacterium]|nr:beta-ketoacyl synthase N-terminal-like domain-containing protein [Kofleriaceae bacterium]